MVVVDKLTFAATPGYNYSVFFTSNGIDLTKKSNKDYMAVTGNTDLDYDLKIAVR
jgi:hypothetical protein